MNTLISSRSVLFIAFVFSLLTLQAQDNKEVVIKTTQVSDNVYMLEGQGGNIGVSIGDDGVFIIDDQFAPLSEKILTALKALSNGPLKYVVNTHFHGDHTGGNQNMTKAGATIIAHDNVRQRMEATKTRQNTDHPKEALPVITFNDTMNLYMNGEQVAIFHVDNAHTDGDALLYFTQSNVLHTGDTFFNGRYPYIDLKSGGSIDGCIAAVSRAILLLDNDSKIIPGHGPIANKMDYDNYLSMLKVLRQAVQGAIDNGKTLEEVKEDTRITQTYDDMGYGSGFINSERIRETIYKSLTN